MAKINFLGPLNRPSIEVDISNLRDLKEIFKEEKLAEELLKTTEKDKTQIIILKHIIKKFN